MTLPELSNTFFKAHLLMGIGCFIGHTAACGRSMSYPYIVGLLTGLLCSLHLYKKCLIVLIDEYKRLKSKSKNENIS